MTDSAGRYQAEFEAMRDAVGGVGGSFAEQPGYETHRRYLGPRASQDMTQNFHLYRIRRITPGDSVTLTVRPDEPMCGFDSEWVCRTVRIVANKAGKLTLSLTSHDRQSETGLEVIEGSPFRPKCCSQTVTMDVAVGAEVLANPLVRWETQVDHSFTLLTRLEE